MPAPIPLRLTVAAGDWIAVSSQLALNDGTLVDDGAQAQAAQAVARRCQPWRAERTGWR